MTSGKPWQDWLERAAACPPEWEFGFKFRLPDGSEWVCLDRGEKIVYEEGIPWVDLLTAQPKYEHGEIQVAEVIE